MSAKPLCLADDPPLDRLAYRVDELARLVGVSRRTIQRAIADGRLKSTRRLGARLVSAESVKALFGETA